jgi:glycerol-3-phosphate dehydrogenase (NAD(P)+)
VTKIAVLGGGSWGTGLSIVLSRSRHAHEISLWVREPAIVEAISTTRENKTYLPGIEIPACVAPSVHLNTVLERAQIVIGAVPSAHTREVFTLALPFISPSAIVVSATKGLEPATHLRISQVMEQVCSQRFVPELAVLSGPSFAQETARGEPTAVVIASRPANQPLEGVHRTGSRTAEYLQEQFAGPTFRLYTNDDVLGVELSGAMKNVMAIAAGACQGLGLGANSLAALITRGLAEMTRLAVKLGAKHETLSGLAGLGDLVLTCTGSLSRNRHVGFELGKGRSLSEILGRMSSIAEGVGTASALLALAEEHRIDLPITEQVNAILNAWKSPAEAIRDIMERRLKSESLVP